MKTYIRTIVIWCLLFVLYVPSAQASLSLQELGDSLMAYTGFSRVWAPPVRVKNMRVNGNNVTLKTNGTLRDYRWTPEDLAEVKRKVSIWTLGHDKGSVTIYSNNTDIATLITACARGTATGSKQKDLTERNIVVYPSHGLFYNRTREEWIWQRATLWTTVEDLYSQEYVRLVKRMLENAGANVLMPRAGLEHQELGVSGMPQWTEGARYWLQSQQIDSTLWNLYDGNEYKDDMKCRGMWVNAQDVPIDLCLAFHTDGNDSGNDSTVIGTLVIYTAKDDDGRTTLRDGRDREQTNRNLGDYIQTQIMQDLRHIAPEWTRRQLKEANYCETRMPVVPSIILELLSHKNMADMKYGLNPAFRFAAARAVYKGILRYINGPSAVVQPLPVKELSINTDGILRWRASVDSIEASAMPNYYMVYVQANDGEWDVQQVENATQCQMEIQRGVKYNYYVVAGNDGGLSLPSPIVSAYRSEQDDAPMVLIVDGFDEVYGPEWFADSTYAGIVPGSYACEDRFSCAYIGQQWDYTRSHGWVNDDNCGFGSCYRDHAGQLTVGNTHDYTAQHGRVLRKMKISYVSCTANMLETMRNEDVPEFNFSLVDFICGRNRKPLSESSMNMLEIYLGQVGSILLSTDHFSAIDKVWAKRYLHATYHASHATHSGRVTTPRHRLFQLMLEPNEEQLFTCTPEGLKPEKEAIKMATYEDMRCTAGVGWQAVSEEHPSTTSRTLVYGFPLEACTDFDKIYEQSIEWILE